LELFHKEAYVCGMEDVSFISWVQNPNDKEDGFVVVNEGFWHELPERFKSDLIQYFKEVIKKANGK
jgi:hypothetical protein